MNIQKNIYLIIIISLMFFGCQKNVFFSESVKFADDTWSINQSAKFTVPVDDSNSSYNIKIYAKHAKIYAYNNLWVFLKITTPENKVQFDTLNMLFIGNHQYTGECNSNYCENIFTLADSVKFTATGTYTFDMIQGLRQDSITGINKIGLIIEKN